MTAEKDDEGLEALLDYLKSSRNFDFRAYKRPTLLRRIDRRMRVVGVSDFREYQARLESEPGEFIELFNTVLINVTNFFRDEIPWDFLGSDILPRILAEKHPHDSIRVWSAGCATGQEAYTIAMVLAESLGLDEFRSRVKIYATDIDDDALSAARRAVYSEKDIGRVPEQMLAKYFEKTEDGYAFRKDLRRCVIFGRHDLLQDAPISKIDMLVCRNTLMYFNAAAQARILARFHFALTDNGFLFLGRAETLLAHTNTFAPFDIKRHVFRKIPPVRFQHRLTLVGDGGGTADSGMPVPDGTWEAAFDASGVPQIVIDRKDIVAFINAGARDLFQLQPTDVGRPFHELEVSYRPVELRSVIAKANAERRQITVSSAEWSRSPSDIRCLDIFVTPLASGGAARLGTTISFLDVTERQRLQQRLETSSQELDSAYHQLQSTNEELETTNEELQSTVEELETTNEELQSTNEELETMNEELHSTNEELSSVNDMARQYTVELDTANAFLESIFTGLGHRIIVVDRDLKVTLWNSGAEDLWGVRAEEAMNVPLSELDSEIPVAEMTEALTKVMNDGAQPLNLRLPVTNRRGRKVNIVLTIAALPGDDGAQPAGAILMMKDAPR